MEDFLTNFKETRKKTQRSFRGFSEAKRRAENLAPEVGERRKKEAKRRPETCPAQVCEVEEKKNIFIFMKLFFQIIVNGGK